MKSAIFLCCFCFITSVAFAQIKRAKRTAVKLPNAIENDDKRKVEKAKKLLNKGKLLDGEKLLVELRNENMNQSYFHEALVQIQKQILDQIKYTQPSEDEDGEYFLYANENIVPEKNLEETFIDNGLARTTEEKEKTVDNIRLSRNDKKKLKKALREQEKEVRETREETGETITKPQSLNPMDAAKAAINKENAELKKQATSDRKNAKNENDIFLIPYESYSYELIKNCRLATLKHERVDSASHYLRILLVDTIRYDTMLTQNEMEAMYEAMDFYYARDFRRAAKKLESITDNHQEYFPGHWILAECYFKMGLDTPSYKQFVYVAQIFPERPEGFEGLSRYFLAKGKYTEAAASIIKAIALYPEDAYFMQLNTILKRTGKNLNSQWIRREVYPLKTDKNYEDIIAKEKSPWQEYQQVKSELYSYATEDGILRVNEITTDRYLEYFAWKTMLGRSYDGNLKEGEMQNFPFARAMQKMGYLDCYIFISLFHHDIYGAFKDFVMLNPDKVETYFYILLNWEDEKFDEFRPQEVKKSSKEKAKK